jgi:REP element-mobilizing transposase RayT
VKLKSRITTNNKNNFLMADKVHPHRKSIRLPKYDYAQEGAYFITVVTKNRNCLFGQISEGIICLNPFGNIVSQVWESIPKHHPKTVVHPFIIMPNHIHGIINIVRARRAVPLHQSEEFGKPVPGSIPTIVRSFKSESTRRINVFRNTPGAKVWQRNYYEHVIRGEKDYESIYEYILTNPQNWLKDNEYQKA